MPSPNASTPINLMDHNNVEKLIHGLNYVVRANDTEKRGDLHVVVAMLQNVLTSVISLTFDQNTRQFRLTNSAGLVQADPFAAVRPEDASKIIAHLLDKAPPKCQAAALVQLATMRLEGKIPDL